MNLDYIKQRVTELFTYVEALKTAANEDAKEASEIIKNIKEAESEEHKLTLIKTFKKKQFFNNLKMVEIEKTVPVLVELISVAKVVGIDLNLTDEQEFAVDNFKKQVHQLYVYDRNELTMVNKELEEAVDKEIDNPSETELQALKNLLNTLSPK